MLGVSISWKAVSLEIALKSKFNFLFNISIITSK